jgi:hypothetical protein
MCDYINDIKNCMLFENNVWCDVVYMVVFLGMLPNGCFDQPNL